MHFFRFFHNIRQLDKPSAVAIGSFDGMHLGHQAILNLIKKEAKAKGLLSVVILFEPQPKEYFAPKMAPPRIMRLEDKLLFLADFGIDVVVCLRFDEHLANLSATRFVEEVLINQLKIQYLTVGQDFRFGAKRQGNITLLKQAALVNGFELNTQDDVETNSIRISSTQIRSLINQGDIKQAAKLLGHPLLVSGRITHGQKRGRQIGFPTINIKLKRKMAFDGVFAVKVQGLDKVYEGVANIGVRPTVDGQRYFLETFIFDFDGDIYGRRVSIKLIAKIRDEMMFDSVVELRSQIEHDTAEAKRILGACKTIKQP